MNTGRGKKQQPVSYLIQHKQLHRETQISRHKAASHLHKQSNVFKLISINKADANLSGNSAAIFAVREGK